MAEARRRLRLISVLALGLGFGALGFCGCGDGKAAEEKNPAADLLMQPVKDDKPVDASQFVKGFSGVPSGDEAFLAEALADETDAALSASYLEGVWVRLDAQTYPVGLKYYELVMYYSSRDVRTETLVGDESAYLGVNRKGYFEKFKTDRRPEPGMDFGEEGYSRYSVPPGTSRIETETLTVIRHDGEVYREENRSKTEVAQSCAKSMVVGKGDEQTLYVRLVPPVEEKIRALNRKVRNANTAVIIDRCERELENGGSLDRVKGFRSEPVVIEAVKNANKKLVRYAIDKGADVSVRIGDFRRTPFFFAGQSGDVEIADMLLAAGADIDAVDEVGYTALSNAIITGHVNMSKYLIAKGASLSRGQYTHSVDDYPPLLVACRMNDVELLQMIVDRGVDVDQPVRRDRDGGREDTALIQAARRGEEKAVDFLVLHNADPSLHGYEKKTAAERAAEGKYSRIVSLLDGLHGTPYYQALPGTAPIGDGRRGLFFTAGWSADGKLALLGFLSSAGRPDAVVPFLRVTDLVKDSVVFEKRWEEISGTAGAVDKENIAKLFYQNKKLICTQLLSSGVHPVLGAQVLAEEFREGGRVYRVTREESPERALYLSSGAERKKITSLPSGDDVAVLGVLRSPYEKRIAVVLSTGGGIKVCGSHLSVGF
ncbi:MAG: ankyrin repeat domain-containing protein [Spirochaetales bacterium]|nr:ankyrin repeat domain-containing protein [Spirochaetales bacterium]